MAISDYTGGISEMIGNEYAKDAQREALRLQQGGIRDAIEVGGKYYDKLDDAYAGDSVNYQKDLQNWRELSARPGLELGTFDDSVDVASMLDPAMDFRQKQAANAIDQSAANSGGIFSGSGATAKALQDRSQAIASDEWGKAYGRADSSMKGKYSRFTDRFNAAKSNEAQQLQNSRGLFDQSKFGRDDGLSAMGGRTNMDMSSIRELAGIDAQVKNNDAANTKAQWNIGGRMAGQAGDDMLAVSTDGGNL